MNLTKEEFDVYLRTATPSKIDAMFHKPQVPKVLQSPEIKDRYNGQKGITFDDWLKTFEAKARYVDKNFLVANLLEELGNRVRTSVEVQLGDEDTSRVNYKEMCDYVREELQREDCLNDLLIEYEP
eukprot:SAG11_NODE_10452_length_831_cov_0.748634_1_plen_125_part_10